MFRTLLLAAVFVAVNASAAPSDVPRGKLPRQVVPTAYEVDLRMDARADRYSGVVRIDLDVKEATDHFFIHARGSTMADEITGAAIVWDNTAEVFKVQGGAATAANPTGRVRAVLSPRPEPASAPATSTAPVAPPLAPSRALGEGRLGGGR